MARGSPGRALDLAARQAVALDDAAHEILTRLPDVDYGAVQHLAESFRGAEGFARFELLFERLADQVHIMEVGAALRGPIGSDRWLDAWSLLNSLPSEVEGLNLDRADALWSAVSALRSAARA
jgi:DNA polymerase-3 subunit delta'